MTSADQTTQGRPRWRVLRRAVGATLVLCAANGAGAALALAHDGPWHGPGWRPYGPRWGWAPGYYYSRPPAVVVAPPVVVAAPPPVVVVPPPVVVAPSLSVVVPLRIR